MASKNNIKVLGLGVNRMVGKDTFFSLLSEIDPRFKRVAFADALKDSCEDLCKYFFDKGISQLTPSEKEIFRPILIESGRVGRTLDIDYWVKRAIKTAETFPEESITVITDVRFENEYLYLKKIYGEKFFFVNLLREGAPEPTDEEKKNGPETAKHANMTFYWKTDPTRKLIKAEVQDFYKVYFS